MIRIAVASGKGGTGKTTVATNLVVAAALRGLRAAYLDCDVEEPNGHLFLKPVIAQEQPILKSSVVVDPSLCTGCGLCGRTCQFGALACMGTQVLVFPELCHGCGACAGVCEAGAIREQPREIGVLRRGRAGSAEFIDGTLRVGEAMSTPAIRAVKQSAPQAFLVVLDAPPGVSCPAMETVRGCDLALLVTEPTPFALHDLELAAGMVRAVGVPAAAVINRCNSDTWRAEECCERLGLEVLARMDDDREVARAYAHGHMAREAAPAFARAIEGLLDRVLREGRP